MKRKASLCGTSNDVSILKDVTGNRRILPLNVVSIDYDKMIKIDTDSFWREAFKLWREDFDWKIYNSEDIDYLAENTNVNLEVLPIEELFFAMFSMQQTDFFTERKILNQGEILNLMNLNTVVKPTKFDIKDIFTKNKLSYKVFKFNGFSKKGVELFTKQENNEIEIEDVPF
jgi:hypothetical protein